MPIAINPQNGEALYLDASGQWRPARTAVNPQTKETLAFDGGTWVALPKRETDKYRAAAQEDMARVEKIVSPGTQDLLLQGMTFGGSDELMAGLRTPLEMLKRGTLNPAEGYRYAKAFEDLRLERAKQNAGLAGAVAEIGGGVMTGTGLARAGLSAARMLAPNAGLGARSAASAADAALFGSLAGGLEGNSLEERGRNALAGGVLGGAIGGAAPSALALGSKIASPLISNIRAMANPEKYASAQVARAIHESGRPARDIADEVITAANEGQGLYTVADALGNPGQRMLSAVARSPGRGRTEAVEFLERRQADQARRVINALSEGFDAPQTAQETKAAIKAARDDAADIAYEAARKGAAPVNVANVVAKIDETLQPGVTQVAAPKSGLADDSIESALTKIRARLTDGRSMLTDFTALQRVRADLSDDIQSALRSGKNNRARLLGQVLRELDQSMEAASQGFRAANQQFAKATRVMEAVDEGAKSSTRGRSEDVVSRFAALPPEGQAAFRVGYAEPLIAQAQGAAVGVNKARPLTAESFQREAAAIAPGNDLMQRRIARENRMFETAAHARGGSRTADNLADEASLGVDPTIIGQILGGNMNGALRSMLTAGTNLITGNTPAVREQIARILLQHGQGIPPQALQQMLDDAVRRIEMLQRLASQIGRGAAGGLAVAPAAVQR